MAEAGKLNLLAGNSRIKTLFYLVLGAKPAVVPCGYRIANIERLRIFSALAVVYFHVRSDLEIARNLGTVGILIFLLSLFAFVVNRPGPLDLSGTLRRKARRLLKPWLFWSMVYGAVVLLKALYRDMSFSDAFDWTMLLTGTRIHLWFLPFAFVAAMLLVMIHRALADVSNLFTITAAVLAGALCVFGFSIIQSCVRPPRPLGQWTVGAPAILFGLAVGRITLQQKARDRRNLYVFAVLSTTATCIVVLLCDGPWSDYAGKFALRYCASVTAVCFAMHWQGSLDPISRKLASLSYGIYLVHPLVMVVLKELRIAMQYPFVSLLLVVSISALITDVFKRTPLKQFV